MRGNLASLPQVHALNDPAGTVVLVYHTFNGDNYEEMLNETMTSIKVANEYELSPDLPC